MDADEKGLDDLQVFNCEWLKKEERFLGGGGFE
jgi:hypothetical protein